MITYVNTVLVSNKNGNALASAADLEGKEKKADLKELVGKFVFMNVDPAKQDGSKLTDIYTFDKNADRFKIGVITSNSYVKYDKNTGKVLYVPMVKWSNIINVADIKSVAALDYKEDTEDTITIDFADVNQEIKDLLAAGGCPVVLRLTFKDTPTKYRKWTESYSYTTKPGDTEKEIIAGLAKDITSQPRRARVYVEAQDSKLILTAMPYDDDDSNDTENMAAKVRFDASMYWMNPHAPGWASNNKYDLGVVYEKVAGINYPASGKNVRDRERESRGYLGVLHHCKWYDPKPAMVTDIDNKYDGITIEFENEYRTADDWKKRTKQTVEIYASNDGEAMGSEAIAGGLVANLQSMIEARQNIVNAVSNEDAYDSANY